MSLYEFTENDIFHNRIKTHPRTHFLINNKKIYYNKDIIPLSDQAVTSGSDDTIHHVEQGYLSLYEMNINRTIGDGLDGLIYPFITKGGTLESFSTVSTQDFQGFSYGTKISGSYPLSASISTEYYTAADPNQPIPLRPRIVALKNTLEHYKPLSPHFEYSSSLRNFETCEMKLISIPSIFYGSSIKKGTVKLNFYVTGSLMSTIEDKYRNGELVQTYGSDAGAASTGSFTISLESTTKSDYDNKRVIITDYSGNSKTFLFLNGGTSNTGDTTATDQVVVQISSASGTDLQISQAIMTELETAISSTDLDITTSVVPSPPSITAILLTQNSVGSSGDTKILNPDSITDAAPISFSGGRDANTSFQNGTVQGVVLYNEGFILLTGSISPTSPDVTDNYLTVNQTIPYKWTLWGQRSYLDLAKMTGTDFAEQVPLTTPPNWTVSSSYDISFLGTNYIPTLTMFAHAKQGDLNHSNNQTFIDFNDKPDNITQKPVTSNKFVEDKDKTIANVVQSPYSNHSASFEKTTYISKIGIYDKEMNLIGIAKLATPVRKTESRSYTFKMKLDF